MVKGKTVSVWELHIEENGQITLIAPNGEVLFTINRDTALMIADTLRDAAEVMEEGEE